MDKQEILSSILLSTKELLGIKDPNITAFDTDIIIHINSALQTLKQLGVGPNSGFTISGPSETYQDFLGADVEKFPIVKQYLFLKTKIGFDTPTSSAVLEVYKEMAKEDEWRLMEDVENREIYDE